MLVYNRFKRSEAINLNSCLESRVRFDDSSIEEIFSNPSLVLKDIKSFWENEVPYRLTLEWSEATRVPIDYESFRNILEELNTQTVDDRRKHEAYRLSAKVMEYAPVFESRALPHVCSYLPADTKIDTAVRTACFIPPWAYQAKGNVIINTSHLHWNNDAGMVLNIVVHELFHAGHVHYIEPVDFKAIDTSEKTAELIMAGLQSEGMATYVAYRAKQLFPSTMVDPDYKMLENKDDVLRLSEKINHLFNISKLKSFEEIRDVIWEEGIMSRAYYVVGAYMARKIEELSSKDAVVETILKGARHFINTYNTLAFDDFKILL